MYDITKDSFDAEVLKSNVPVIVDFWASWCGPCQMLAPIIKEIAEEYKDKIKVCKVNVDAQSELAVQFGIVSIPTIIVFKNGEIINKSVGLLSKEEILELIK